MHMLSSLPTNTIPGASAERLESSLVVIDESLVVQPAFGDVLVRKIEIHWVVISGILRDRYNSLQSRYCQYYEIC